MTEHQPATLLTCTCTSLKPIHHFFFLNICKMRLGGQSTSYSRKLISKIHTKSSPTPSQPRTPHCGDNNKAPNPSTHKKTSYLQILNLRENPQQMDPPTHPPTHTQTDPYNLKPQNPTNMGAIRKFSSTPIKTQHQHLTRHPNHASKEACKALEGSTHQPNFPAGTHKTRVKLSEPSRHPHRAPHYKQSSNRHGGDKMEMQTKNSKTQKGLRDPSEDDGRGARL